MVFSDLLLFLFFSVSCVYFAISVFVILHLSLWQVH